MYTYTLCIRDTIKFIFTIEVLIKALNSRFAVLGIGLSMM